MTGSAPVRWTFSVNLISIEGEESEEREGSGSAAGREAGGFMSWALLGSFLLLFTVFWAPRPENENAKLNYFRT